MLEHVVRRGESLAGQQGGIEAVAGAVADMQRLGHGAEVSLEAGGEAGGERDRDGHPRCVQPHQATAGRGRAEHAERGRRVPALFVMVKIHRAAEAGFHLETRDIGIEEIPSAHRHAVGPQLVGEREQGGQDRRGGMAAHRVGAVVEIERVGGRAVDQRGVERSHAPVRAEHQGRAGRGADLERHLCAGLWEARQRDADEIEHAHLRPVDRLRWQVGILHGADAVCDLAGESGHGVFLTWTFRSGR